MDLGGVAITHLVATFVYFFVLVFVRRIAERVVRNRSSDTWSPELRLRTIGNIRSTFLGILIFGMVFIWAEELRTFTVSVFAIAVAVVMALNELIRCIHGYLLLMRNSAYSLGDRIEIQHFKGDVISINLFSTTLLEVGISNKNTHQGTGRIVYFPNSLLLTSFVVNNSLFEDFSFVTINIPMSSKDNWNKARAVLLEIAYEETQLFLEKARRKAKKMAQKHEIEILSVEPRVFISLTSADTINISLRVSAPSHLKDCVEQSILTRFLEEFFKDESI